MTQPSCAILVASCEGFVKLMRAFPYSSDGIYVRNYETDMCVIINRQLTDLSVDPSVLLLWQ
jgi:hypothetical protein